MICRARPHAQTRRMVLWTIALIVVTTSAGGAPPVASTLSPAHKIDLSFLGTVAEPPLSHLIQFVNKGRLAVAITVHGVGPAKLVRRGEMDSRSAFVLRAAIVDANSGKVLKQASWPTDFPRHSGLVTATDSKLVVLLGNRVALYSRQLALLKQLKLPGESGETWIARASPSGRNAVFVEDAGFEPVPWVWFDVTHFHVLRVWKAVPRQPGGQGSPISDTYITVTRCLPPGGVPPCKLIAYSPNDEAARIVRGINLRYGYPEFVSNDLLFVHGIWGDISVVNLAKKRVIRRRSPGLAGSVIGSPASAPAVSRFVVPVFGRDDRMKHLDVFDGPVANLRVFRIRGVPAPGRARWLGASPWSVSLSPDGSLLAVLENYKALFIFRLPPLKGG